MPNILNFVKNFHYYSKLFNSLLRCHLGDTGPTDVCGFGLQAQLANRFVRNTAVGVRHGAALVLAGRPCGVEATPFAGNVGKLSRFGLVLSC